MKIEEFYELNQQDDTRSGVIYCACEYKQSDSYNQVFRTRKELCEFLKSVKQRRLFHML